ncbi:MAG TPA: helix-turn-helix domain-containing protein [Opitutales bacterium]|nr:helix-turn-helix domain-containing protein [Opitutales bacterium]
MNKKKPGTKPDTDSITAREAAKILKIHPGTLGNWRCIGVGPAWSKFGDGPRGNVRYIRADVQAFAKKMTSKVSRS